MNLKGRYCKKHARNCETNHKLLKAASVMSEAVFA